MCYPIHLSCPEKADDGVREAADRAAKVAMEKALARAAGIWGGYQAARPAR